MPRKRSYKHTNCDDTEHKIAKIDDSSKIKSKIVDSSKITCNGVNLCDLVNPLRRNLNKNIVNNLVRVQSGNGNVHSLSKASRDVLIRNVSSFDLYKNELPFERRITSIEWHPSRPHLLAVASKGGDLLLWDCEASIHKQLLIHGKGAGGAVQCIKFHPEKEMHIFTASIDGTVSAWDYHNRTCSVFLKTQNYDKWYTSLDVSPVGGHLVAGCNTGSLSMLSLSGELVWKFKLHKTKITHTEYNVRQPWLLATASVDHTVKLWDVRNIGPKNALSILHHDRAVNSANFSKTDATQLLTTDQHSQLRVYKGPLWELDTLIPHPHRHFQHLTPIKATWHPLEDIVVVGRYPDEKFPDYMEGETRTIDFIEPETAKYMYGLSKHGLVGIVSLNQFNILGDTLASAMGFRILIWRPNWENEKNASLKSESEKKLKRPRDQVKQTKSKQ